MIVNNTCVPGNETSTCLATVFPTGLAVGLTVFFLLLVIVGGIVACIYRSEIRNVALSGHKRSQMEGHAEMPESVSHQYITLVKGETPIYENLKTSKTSKPNSLMMSHKRMSEDPDEDLYLQYDLTGDPIYSNDPECVLSISQEDVYVVPDS